MKRHFFLLTLLVVFGFAGAVRAAEVHALWAHPPEAGTTAASVRAFVAKCKRAHIDVIVMDVKDSNGGLYWKSKKFPQAIARGYENFDMLEHLVREAHAVGIRVDAWLVDYLEGANGAAIRAHPEWAQLNPNGETTLSEKLGKTRPYPYVWMCPAQRPGYTDQWLIPLYEEIAANYKVDSLHHDYIRYPGDVAPDSYCFCDYCLKNIPRYAMLSYETRADERYRVTPAQNIIHANWWSDPTMIPADWDKLDRREKADYILNGRTIPGGQPDMRYFFYDYRVHQIDKFARETTERVKKINPKTEISAAVFKNPILSARFIGQHWERWNPWIDVYMPMTYRSHFAGSFDAYLDHLTETTERQLEWTGRGRPLYAGIASTYLYREEFQPLDTMRDRLAEMQTLPATDVKSRTEKARDISAAFDSARQRLAQFAPSVEKELAGMVSAVTSNEGSGATAANMDQLAKRLAAFRADVPPGFCPPEKLAASINAARRAKPHGIAIFAAGSLDREKLWEVLEREFADKKVN
ncbi:MAG TPA: putative glycoside hydrolase [Pyrinomonadaceae bacterium]|nr:putative glycoside hydrolase [Pyrinomonadaceae bacterium]